MSLETAVRIGQLNPNFPSGADLARTADDHLRLIKSVFVNNLGDANDEKLTVPFSILNKVLEFVIPVGVVVPFALATDQVPKGWALCDGRQVDRSDGTAKITTPDLRGRAIVGASETRPTGTLFGQVARTVTTEAAGGHTHTASSEASGTHKHSVTVADTVLTEAQMPAHKHGSGILDAGTSMFNHGSFPANPTTSDSIDNNGDNGRNEAWSTTVGGGQAHGHGVTENDAGSHSHTINISPESGHAHSVTVNTEQPSVTINFIMKI